MLSVAMYMFKGHISSINIELDLIFHERQAPSLIAIYATSDIVQR